MSGNVHSRQNGYELTVSSRMAIQRIQTLREKKEALAKARLSTSNKRCVGQL